ncbi:MAG: nucleotidyltransferase domain-containing protein [Firmicutes bacterium]|nr:nucleotidyltransferase domain-containing protein [Bacillota bacterium]
MTVPLLNLNSKLRRRLLALFFTNPENRYYVRQLEGLLGFSAGNIRNELLRLKRENLFTTEQVGNLVFYKLNLKHPLYKEIKTILAKTIGVEGALREAFIPLSGIKSAFVFGSFAAGEEASGSDIDLLIIGLPDFKKIRGLVKKQEEVLQREINYHVYSPSEWQQKKEEKNSFLLNVLEKPKIFLKGDETCI